MGTTYSQQEFLLDGEIQIFILASSAKNLWQVRFKNPLDRGARYIRKSSGSPSKAIATKFALNLYHEFQSRALLGLHHGRTTISDLFTEYIEGFSKVSKTATTSFFNRYWLAYFGEEDLTTITNTDLKEYFEAKVKNRDDIVAMEHRKSTTSISYDNLIFERNCLQRLFWAGYEHHRLPRKAVFPKANEIRNWSGVHKLPRNNRRGRFDREKQYPILMDEFRRIERGLRNEASKPQLHNVRQEHDPENNPYVSVSKRDGANGRTDRDSEFCSKKRRYPSATFWFSSLLMSNSGIRPSELVQLRHQDIELVRDKDRLWTLINIPATVSKVRKFRQVICSDFHNTFRRYLKYREELKYFFNREPQPNDFIFPQPNGADRYIKPRKHLDNLFRPRLHQLGLSKQTVQDPHNGHLVQVPFTAYSFRAFYITERLRNGCDIYTLSKAAGTSIKTISTSYDYNEGFSLRAAMTKHLTQRDSDKTSDKQSAALADYVQDWTSK